MHDEFGYLGAPGVVPKRAVTAQMLRDLVNFQSSLPVNDQWRIKSWIRLLQPFAVNGASKNHYNVSKPVS